MTAGFLFRLPIAIIFVIQLGAMFGSLALGHHLGVRVRTTCDGDSRGYAGGLHTAMLGLLALLLGVHGLDGRTALRAQPGHGRRRGQRHRDGVHARRPRRRAGAERAQGSAPALRRHARRLLRRGHQRSEAPGRRRGEQRAPGPDVGGGRAERLARAAVDDGAAARRRRQRRHRFPRQARRRGPQPRAGHAPVAARRGRGRDDGDHGVRLGLRQPLSGGADGRRHRAHRPRHRRDRRPRSPDARDDPGRAREHAPAAEADPGGHVCGAADESAP